MHTVSDDCWHPLSRLTLLLDMSLLTRVMVTQYVLASCTHCYTLLCILLADKHLKLSYSGHRRDPNGDIEANFANRDYIEFQPRIESFPLYLDQISRAELLDHTDDS